MTRQRRFCFCCCRRGSSRPNKNPAWRTSSKAFVSQQTFALPHFTVLVEDPESRKVLKFFARVDEPELTLSTVMNYIAFDRDQGDRFDASFMSRHSTEIDDVDYYVQRLLGIEIVNEENPESGPIWNLYVNDTAEDWMETMRKNRIVCKEDVILWRYHFKTEKPSHPESRQYSSQYGETRRVGNEINNQGSLKHSLSLNLHDDLHDDGEGDGEGDVDMLNEDRESDDQSEPVFQRSGGNPLFSAEETNQTVNRANTVTTFHTRQKSVQLLSNNNLRQIEEEPEHFRDVNSSVGLVEK